MHAIVRVHKALTMSREVSLQASSQPQVGSQLSSDTLSTRRGEASKDCNGIPLQKVDSPWFMPSIDLGFGERPANMAPRRFFARGVRQPSQLVR